MFCVASSTSKGIKMEQKRQGEIALALFKLKLGEDGIRIKLDVRREIGDAAKKLGIPIDEAMEFYEIIVREMVEKVFAKSTGK